jgi:hypothetical protein
MARPTFHMCVSIRSFHVDLRQALPLLYEILDRRWGFAAKIALLRKSMAKYRHDLPHRRGGTFLTDGGQVTELIFRDGFDLPHFAAFNATCGADRFRGADRFITTAHSRRPPRWGASRRRRCARVNADWPRSECRLWVTLGLRRTHSLCLLSPRLRT